MSFSKRQQAAIYDVRVELSEAHKAAVKLQHFKAEHAELLTERDVSMLSEVERRIDERVAKLEEKLELLRSGDLIILF